MARLPSSALSDRPVDLAAERVHKQAIRLLRRLRREDAATGLSPARASALSVLVFNGPSSLGDLASTEQVSAPTMSRLVAALVADGLVARAGDPTDGRAVRLRATPRGIKLLGKGRERRLRVFAELLSTLSEAEIDTLLAAADLLARAVR